MASTANDVPCRYERLLRKLLVLPKRPAVILLQAFRGFADNGWCAAGSVVALLDHAAYNTRLVHVVCSLHLAQRA